MALGTKLQDSSGMSKMESLYAEFKNIKSEIIRLSRENSNIRSVAIALNEKPKAMLDCQDAFAALENAIRAEPIKTAIPKGRSE